MWGKWVATVLAIFAPTVTIVSTGDVMVGRTINSRAVATGDFGYAFKNLVTEFKGADAVLINLEAPLVTNCPSKTDGMVFCGDVRFAKALKDAGVTEVGIANNHTENYGKEGLQTTKEALKSAGLAVVDETISYRKVKGVKLAFVAFNALGEKPEISEVIKEAKTKADLVIAEFHFGNEYTATPTALQKNLAHEAIDAGADLVLGNHPHWVQPTEYYKNKLIVYAQGNTVFDQYWSEETKRGILGKYTFKAGKLIRVQFVNVYTNNNGMTEVKNSAN